MDLWELQLIYTPVSGPCRSVRVPGEAKCWMGPESPPNLPSPASRPCCTRGGTGAGAGPGGVALLFKPSSENLAWCWLVGFLFAPFRWCSAKCIRSDTCPAAQCCPVTPSDALPVRPSFSPIPRAGEDLLPVELVSPWESSSPRALEGPRGSDGGVVLALGVPLPNHPGFLAVAGLELLLFLSCIRKDFCECHKPITWAEPG